MNNEKLRDSNELRSGNMTSQFFFQFIRGDELEDPDANDAAPVLPDGRWHCITRVVRETDDSMDPPARNGLCHIVWKLSPPHKRGSRGFDGPVSHGKYPGNPGLWQHNSVPALNLYQK